MRPPRALPQAKLGATNVIVFIFMTTKEAFLPGSNECEEDDPDVLAALDEALTLADAAPDQGYSAGELRDRLGRWTSK
jgi:hypothetical protein